MTERVLIVDDAKDIRDFLRQYILEPKGFEVFIAADGVEGLEMALAEQPDLMIVDQQMPRLTGLEMLEKLRDRGVEIPAILATAHGSEETAVAAFRLGVRDYVIKPYDANEIEESIDRALRETRLQAERDRLVQQLMNSNSQLQRRAQELNVLYGVGKSVASSLNLEEVLHRVVEAAVFVVGAEEGSLMLLDPGQGELYVRASKNMDNDAKTERKRVTDSLAGKVLQTRRPIVIGKDSQWKRTSTALLVKSLVYVPLILHDKPVGVLGVTNHKKEGTFNSNDTRALSALGSYGAIAINNASIYSQIERERNTLSAIIDQTDDLLLVVDGRNCLSLINEAARDILTEPGSVILGQPINVFLKDANLLEFIFRQTESLSKTKTIAINGRLYEGLVTAIAGGSRSIYLRSTR